jgi:signal transduction histidine kinase
MIDKFEGIYQARGVQVNLCIEREDAPLWADEAQMEIILRNLLSNAAKFTPDGGMVTVNVDVTSEGSRLTVCDTGSGIAPEDQERIFERFYRVQARDRPSTPGTGIGLSLVKELVEQHGGSVKVESELGQGATFTVWLPSPRTANKKGEKA